MSRKWTKDELVKMFEVLVEKEQLVLTRPEFRNGFSREENLVINQLIRKATDNIAYKSVDFKVDEMSDEEIWEKIEDSKYLDLLEDNAADSIMSVAGKLGLLH